MVAVVVAVVDADVDEYVVLDVIVVVVVDVVVVVVVKKMIKGICHQIVGSFLCIISVSTEASERKRKHMWAKLFNKSNKVKIPLYI